MRRCRYFKLTNMQAIWGLEEQKKGTEWSLVLYLSNFVYIITYVLIICDHRFSVFGMMNKVRSAKIHF